MTKDDIIRMAQEAGWSGIYSQWVSPTEREHLTVPVTMEQIERFAALVAAAEREAIAQMIEDAPPLVDFAKNKLNGCVVCGFTPKLAASTIRTKGQ